jgi:cytochrome c2
MMPTLFLKSIVSLFMMPAAIIAIYTMFEIFGRDTQKHNIGKFKTVHKVNGIIYALLFLFITYYCLNFIISSKVELSSRATFHSIFALTILVLLCLKISIIRIYRQFYTQARILGLLIALITFGMIGTSGIYYLLVSEFGTHSSFAKGVTYQSKDSTKKLAGQSNEDEAIVNNNSESIGKGKILFEENCLFCHDPYSTQPKMGPGLMGILKNPLFPVSKKEATPENIIKQLKEPYGQMPSFTNLQDDAIDDLIAFLDTL